MKRIYPFVLAGALALAVAFSSCVVRADVWGGDVAVLLQILTQTIQELAVLRQTLDLAKGDSDLLQRVNRDIDSALTEVYAIQSVVRETNEIGKTRDPVELLNRLRSIYGRIPRLGNIKGLEFSDKVSGNAFGTDNDSHQHADLLDADAVRLQEQARNASPGRSQQLTAQSQTTIIHSLAQIERNGGTSARIAATQLAMKTNDEKSHYESFDQSYTAMASSKASIHTDLSLGSLQ